MGRTRRGGPNKEARHVRICHKVMKTAAWQSLDACAKALYVEISCPLWRSREQQWTYPVLRPGSRDGTQGRQDQGSARIRPFTRKRVHCSRN